HRPSACPQARPDSATPIDSDHAADWASDLNDMAWGRRVRLPGWRGWDKNDLFAPHTAHTEATVTLAIGPEGLFRPLADLFSRASTSIDLSIYTLEHPELCQILADAVGRGVQLRILLEGSPPGGIDDVQRWCVAQIARAGGDVRYMTPTDDAPKGAQPRFRFSHAKYGIIDGRMTINGTENFNTNSMPTTTNPPPGGRRGFYLFTDAAPVIQALQQIFAADWAPDRFRDLRPYRADDEKYGDPPPDFVLPLPSVYTVFDAPFAQPLTVQANARFEVVSAPENALRPDAGLHAKLAAAGPGDEIMLVQLYENKNWGATSSNPIADPNPRLQLLIDAARRGARVRLLLDSYFDEPEALRSNRATTDYLRELAAREQLDLQVRLGNPTGGGIHAKLVLVRLGGEYWSAIGSLNGGEVSYKLNREVVVLTDVYPVFTRLVDVFEHDWVLGK
ncbi:MAG: hypothetical protein HC802_22760, partial [Caldilineaceae bacterium]|nr:hypothetical protein [Caldilineaceae bacterium]